MDARASLGLQRDLHVAQNEVDLSTVGGSREANPQLRLAVAPIRDVLHQDEELEGLAGLGASGRCLAAGCDDYLTKPILSEALYAALSTYYRPETERTPAEHVEPIRSERADDSKFAPLLRDYLKVEEEEPGLPCRLPMQKKC